jgi:hypothetical protein
MTSALRLLDNTIAELEARLNLKPEKVRSHLALVNTVSNKKNDKADAANKKEGKPAPPPQSAGRQSINKTFAN